MAKGLGGSAERGDAGGRRRTLHGRRVTTGRTAWPAARPRREVAVVRAAAGRAGHGGRPPVVPRAQWRCLPQWVALHAERGGGALKCWEGHALVKESMGARRQHRTCVHCEQPQATGSAVRSCRRCRWVVCRDCARRPRLASLAQDPLFHGPSSRFLLQPLAGESALGGSSGTVIVCPGGNYEFRVPQEGLPAADVLVSQGIRAYVLCYRLLPECDFEGMMDDLEDAVVQVRRTHGGPVAALGFSAGGHLVASLPVRQKGTPGQQAEGRLDCQALIYPCIDGSDWAHPEWCGFSHFNHGRCHEAAGSLLSTRDALVGGPGLAAPPTFLVASTQDEATPIKQHADKYCKALRRLGVPCAYLRRDFGPHGFGLSGGWTEECVAWLRARGFGAAVAAPGPASKAQAAAGRPGAAADPPLAVALGGA